MDKSDIMKSNDNIKLKNTEGYNIVKDNKDFRNV